MKGKLSFLGKSFPYSLLCNETPSKTRLGKYMQGFAPAPHKPLKRLDRNFNLPSACKSVCFCE